MKLIAYSLAASSFGDQLCVSIGTSPRYGQNLVALEGALQYGSLTRREDLDGVVEQKDGMPSYPEVYQSDWGPFVAVCKI